LWWREENDIFECGDGVEAQGRDHDFVVSFGSKEEMKGFVDR